MSPATRLTWEQFEQLPERDGVRYELKDGEMSGAKSLHKRTKFRTLRCLFAYILGRPVGEVYAETAFALSPSRVCQPDVAFLSSESVAKSDPEHIFVQAPEVAIRSPHRYREHADGWCCSARPRSIPPSLGSGCWAGMVGG
jgi:Uma2 family endonuclease